MIRVNGGMHKSQMECNIDFSDEERPALKKILKETCKRFGCKEKVSQAVLYNKQGVQIFSDDIDFIKADDVLYIALDGKPSFSALLQWGQTTRPSYQLKSCNTSMFLLFSVQGRRLIIVPFSMTTKCTRKLAKAVLAPSIWQPTK